MNYTAEYFATQLQLQPHPEGGWYKETYRSAATAPQAALPSGFTGARNFSTAIYFLLDAGNFSAFHRIKSDELWHFYYGTALNVYVINESGALSVIRLGSNIAEGEVFQATVKAGCWFASRPAKASSFSLVGCTVAPGFDFADFEMAERNTLTMLYPAHAFIINELTRS